MTKLQDPLPAINAASQPPRRFWKTRYGIVLLLFLLSMENNMDRQTLSVLAPMLRSEIGLTDQTYSYALTAFMVAYAIGHLFCGRVLDTIGVRYGIVSAVVWWSIAAMLHAAAGSWKGIAGARFMLGLGECFNAPAGSKAIGEWIPSRERAFCMSLFTSGNIIGAILAPPLVAFLAINFGWQWTFIVTGASGFFWMVAWLFYYQSPEKHRSISEEEREYILRERGGGAAESPTGTQGVVASIWRNPICWAFVAVKFLTDPLVFFFNFWTPSYLSADHGFSTAMIGFVAWIPFLAADIGSMTGGAASDVLVRRGWAPRDARLRIMLIAACLTPFAAVAVRMTSPALAVGCIAIVLFAQSFWMANLMTSMTEAVGRGQIASLAAAAGFGGSISGIIAMLAAGHVVPKFGYAPMFTVLGFVHLAGFSVLYFTLRSRGRTSSP